MDAILHLQVSGAAGALDGPHQVAREALHLQLGSDLGAEAHGERSALGHRVALRRAHLAQQVVVGEHLRCPIHLDLHGGACVERPDRRRGIKRRHRLGNSGHLVAKARPKRAVVGLEAHFHQALGVGDKAHLTHVQLVGHHLRQPFQQASRGRRTGDNRLFQRLAHLQLGLLAGRAAKRGGLKRCGHGLLKHLITTSPRSGPVGQVNALGCSRVVGRNQIAPHLVGHKRAERRQQQRDGRQAFVERGEGGSPIGGVVVAPETAAAGTHVPVGQVVDERLKRAPGVGWVVPGKPVGDHLGGGIQTRQRPAVHLAALGHRRCGVARGKTIGQRCVGGQKCVGVPQREQEPAPGLIHNVEAESE